MFAKSLLLIITLSPLLSSAGGWSGNGGGGPGSVADDSANIWFLGNQPIPYCVVNQNPKIPTGAVKLLVKQNQQKWRSFFARYGMDQEELGTNDQRNLLNGPNQKISLEMNELSSLDCQEATTNCDAKTFDDTKCYQAIQDKVLFINGTPNDAIKKFLDTQGDLPGISIRSEYNHNTHRSGGIVWTRVTPNQGISSLSHILLHEMGHVFGMQHNSCWVMYDKINKVLNRDFIWGFGGLGFIEGPNWPYSYKAGDLLLLTDLYVNVGGGPSEIPAGFVNASLVPESMRSAYNILLDSFVKVELLIEEVQTYDQNISFVITEQARDGSFRTVKSNGVFSARSLPTKFVMGPGVFTYWKHTNSDGTTWTQKERQALNSGYVSNELMGSFLINGSQVPAMLTREGGLKLSMFLNSTGWWTIQTMNLPSR